MPVQYRYEGNIFSGEKRMELTVVPALSVRSTPEIVIVPTAAGAAAHEQRDGAPPAPARFASPSPTMRPARPRLT